jgi:hypothetical protein
VLDRAQASEVGDGGATLRAKLSPPLQLQKHKRHTVYLDQLSAVNSFNNVSEGLENDRRTSYVVPFLFTTCSRAPQAHGEYSDGVSRAAYTHARHWWPLRARVCVCVCACVRVKSLI